MVINHNLNAMNAHRNMGSTTVSQGKAMEKLSSRLRINRAGDDAAGLAISKKMRSQIRELNQASRNAQDGISLIQTAEGALSETQSIGQRMRELAVQSANGTYTEEDRQLINQEFEQLKNEITRIANDTEFNGNKVLNGNVSGKEIKTEDPKKGTKPAIATGEDKGGDLAIALKTDANKEALAKLGEGKFKLEFANVDGENVNIKLIDSSDFNGGKEYTMESITISKSSDSTPVKFTIGGVELSMDISSIKTDKYGGTVEFTNDATVKGEGVNLQVGANKNQMIGFSIENMRSRELGLGGIDLKAADNSQEAIERLDVVVM